MQSSFIKQVDQVLEITSSNDYDPQKPPIEQIKLEERINRLVYELYKLTDEEIKACIKNSVSDIEYRSWNS